MPYAKTLRNSQTAVLAVYAVGSSGVQEKASQAYILAVYAAVVFSRYVYTSQDALLAPYAVQHMTSPNVSQLAALVVYATAEYTTPRSRAWTFTMDGHVFYVLDLSEEGTFLFDTTTGAWCQFITEGYPNWNMHFGTAWGGGRIAGADAVAGYAWELDPTVTEDEDFRDIDHVVTGGIQTRSRTSKAVERFVLATSAGALSSVTDATISLRWSDDQGNTWTEGETITLDPTNFNQEVAWRSLGAFAAPGRIFEVSDVGGVIRIDGANAGIDDFDEDTVPG